MFRAYEKYEKAERDYISGINAAKREARQEALRETARKLKARGLPLGEIAKDTGLDVAIIKEL